MNHINFYKQPILAVVQTTHLSLLWTTVIHVFQIITAKSVLAFECLYIIAKLSVTTLLIATAVLLVASVMFCWKKYNPSYLRTFPVYALLNAVATFLPAFIPNIVQYVNLGFSVVDVLYFSYFFGLLLPGKKRRQYIIAADIIGIVAVLIIDFSYHGFGLLNFECFLSCAMFIPLSLIWFRDTFRRPVFDNLARQPSYWFVTAILLYYCVLLPTLIFCNYVAHQGLYDLADAFYSANNYIQVLTYTLFIIGMTCRRKQPL